MRSSSPPKAQVEQAGLHQVGQGQANEHQASQDTAVQEIDALFQAAGLVRTLRGNSAGVTRRVRLKREAQEELSAPAPVPRLSLIHI